MAILLVACGGNGDGGGTIDTIAPTVSKTNPNSGFAITAGDSIGITFDETIDTTSLVLGGDMASESDGGNFSTSTKPIYGSSLHLKATDDTLTINPQTAWNFGNDRNLSIDAKDLSGNPLETLNLIFTIVEGLVYVSPTGDDANDGTKDSPKATIPAAIAEAQGLGYDATLPGAVLVSQGTYSVNSDPSIETHVILEEGISIYGGYSTDFSQRESEANTTIIEDMSTAAPFTPTPPNRVIDAGSGITAATVVDGFTIQGGGGTFSSGIFNHDGTSPTVQNNTIDGGSGGNDSYGIYNDPNSTPTIKNNTIDGGNGRNRTYGIFNTFSSPIIQNNTIDGGNGGDQSYGIYNNSDSTPNIQNNTIDGGNGGNFSSGIFNNSSSPIIQNNTIYGGNGGRFSFCIFNGFSSPSIKNNTIDGGSGGNVSSGIFNASSSPAIQNNIIMTSGNGSTRTCINEDDNNSVPTSIQNNDLFDCPTALYVDFIDGNLLTIGEINNLTDSDGNVTIDPGFVDRDGGDWRLTSTSPTEVTQGGLDLSTNPKPFSTDKDGFTRTVPWSIGAYELDWLPPFIASLLSWRFLSVINNPSEFWGQRFVGVLNSADSFLF